MACGLLLACTLVLGLGFAGRQFLLNSKLARALTPPHTEAKYEQIQRLVAAGAWVETHGEGLRGCTPLFKAVAAGDTPFVAGLLARGARVDRSDARQWRGATPLMIAAFSGHDDVVSLLLMHGADPNARDATGATPLDYAGAYNLSKTEALLKRGGAKRTRYARDPL